MSIFLELQILCFASEPVEGRSFTTPNSKATAQEKLRLALQFS